MGPSNMPNAQYERCSNGLSKPYDQSSVAAKLT